MTDVRAAVAEWDENPASWSSIYARLIAVHGESVALNTTLTEERRAARRRRLLAEDDLG